VWGGGRVGAFATGFSAFRPNFTTFAAHHGTGSNRPERRQTRISGTSPGTAILEARVANHWFQNNEDGAVTVDYVVVMAVLVGLGAAISDMANGGLNTHSGNLQGELQNGIFETAWDNDLAVQPDTGAGETCTGGNSCDPGTGTGGGDPTNPDPVDPDPVAPDPVDPDPVDPDPVAPDPVDPDPVDPDPVDPDPVDPDPTTNPPDASPPAAGCPNTAYYGVPIVSDGSDFGNSNDYTLRTTGYTNIQSCSGLPRNRGFFDANPSYTLFLSDMDQLRRVQFLIESATCDTTLLIRTESGTYYFNDDYNYPNHLRSRLRFTNPSVLNGRVDVWIGGYNPGSCNSTLEIREY